MHALIVDPDVPGSLRLGTAPEPEQIGRAHV